MHKAILIFVVGLTLSAAGCDFVKEPTSRTFQGVYVALENDGKTLTLENSEPTLNKVPGKQAVFDLTNAKVGLPPEAGDVLRVAYFEEEGSYRAIKVMNVTKQDLRQK